MRNGLSAVYGFVVIYLLIMAGMAAISSAVGSEFSLQQSSVRAAQVGAVKSSEHLSLLLQNGSLFASNDGATLSTLEFMVSRSGSGTTFAKVSYQLPVGANVTLPAPVSASRVGIVTASGNLFWDQQGSSLRNCPNGSSTLTMAVTPDGGGMASPAGLDAACDGQALQILATPSPGYTFSDWTGKGTGSYTGTSNPALIIVRGPIVETAHFIPAVSIISLNPSEDGVASGGQAKSATLLVSGIAQLVSLSTKSLPPGVSVTFSPATVLDSPAGAPVNMTVSFKGTGYGLFPVSILGTGADNQTGSATYTLQATPPNGNLSAIGTLLNPDGLGNPREHKTGYWLGSYFLAFTGKHGKSPEVDLVAAYYSGGWTADSPSTLATIPFNGYNFDLAQASNEILSSSLSYNGANLCYNIGDLGGTSVSWQFVGAACGGDQTPTKYTPTGYASSLIDSKGNWWAAVQTSDSSGNYHIEVLTATNGAWGEVFSDQFSASIGEPVPQLLQLGNGQVVLLYTLFNLTSGCFEGDYFVTTGDGGYSWSSPTGPLYAGGDPLCYDRSSGTTIGNRLFVGGVNSAGALAYWSYDFDTGSYSTSTVLPAADYASMGSVGNVLVMAYTTANTCAGGNSLYLLWSYDQGATWKSSGNVDCVRDYVILPAVSQTYQIVVLADSLVFPGLTPRFDFFTV